MLHLLPLPVRRLCASLALFASSLLAQDVVTLHSVTLDANDDVTVVYSKNFATCAHMRFNNASCTQSGALTHVANHFCAQGTNVSITLPSTAFVSGFGPGISVFMVHGNNPGVQSPCVTVECDGVFGIGCAGATGVPVLDSVNACPPAGGQLDLDVSNAAAGSLAVLGFGLGQTSIPLFGCTLLLNPVLATTVVVLDGSGNGTFVLPLPPGTTGASITAQAFVLDAAGPQGFSATNGLLVRIL
jgi:hypothetical protein